MRARWTIVAATWALCAHVEASLAAPVDPALARALQGGLDTHRAHQGIAGFSAAVWTSADALWLGVSGISSPGEPLHAEMLFGVGSITKTWTAAAVLQLVGEGVLGLDDSLGASIPCGSKIPCGVTIRQLLTHTSGISNYTVHPRLFATLYADPTRHWSPAEVLDRFVLAPEFEAGTRWSYSNTNYVVLGTIVEALTGSSLHDVLRQRLLAPLALERTFLAGHETIPDAWTSEWVDAWSDIDSDGHLDNIGNMPRMSLYSATWGAGAMASTARDTALWIHALFRGDVLPDSLRTLMTMAEPLSATAGAGYGLGAARFVVDDEVLWGHVGGIPGFVSVALYSEAYDVVVVVLANQDRAKMLRVGADLFRIVRDHHSSARAAQPGAR